MNFKQKRSKCSPSKLENLNIAILLKKVSKTIFLRVYTYYKFQSKAALAKIRIEQEAVFNIAKSSCFDI